jgi:predicted proteasome-type protease
MTAKEKAVEIRFTFWRYADVDSEQATRCALIAVDEILKSNPIIPLSYMLESEALDAGIDYWKKVKQEIKKL